ncbi:MAG: hypothetical protein WCX65_02305 [bacterium]
MAHLALSDYVLLGIIVMMVIGKAMKLCGWDRGALIADELEDALQRSRELIAGARAGEGAFNIDKASEAAAARIKGASAADVRPIVESLVSDAADNRYGVSVTLDSDGNVKVDPSGLAAKAARKAGKWLKKVF